ncbi:MAG: ATP-dependent DNA helicase RecQ [Candidatus Moanabacter tarae]|uniref:ATP-dependent DNA helicase RecQ n=1 Tax=Candidatus Moanibacter tarae TaxID=2200854 RepID=A0A2Z4ADJ1_9BACT|nr:MAG: ATP-dependent DNA helicase RecQ [Candidatus Moanabacter tarae]|tara:strand:+ start:22798 stop:24657 length:1860 start_codon:yes stop_codon:yes gene_type:complete
MEKALKTHFGFDSFRPGQRAVIDAILKKRDIMVVMPTGGGKSLCYQLPAVMIRGITIVVSPLIALMKDQVDSLIRRSIPATFINSSLSRREQDRRVQDMKMGIYTLIYVAPERFRNTLFLNALKGVEISFFAIDEAHCVSMWGHDFRPDYLGIGRAIDKLGHPPIAAFTATATPEVRADIIRHLNINEGIEFVTGFRRSNLGFRVEHVSSEAAKMARLSEIIESRQKGIVYCATRRRVELISEKLSTWDIAHISYHAGMDDEQRREAQESFMTGKADVAVATNAFGMGIDRADIRFVVHFELPGSLEAYYQEAGRGGRDGEFALCLLLFNYADKRIQEFFIEGGNPSDKVIRSVYSLLRNVADGNGEIHLPTRELIKRMGGRTNGIAVSTALTILSRIGAVERFDVVGSRTKGTRLTRADLMARDLKIDLEVLSEKKERDWSKLKEMIQYAYAETCRQQWILNYFGERERSLCEVCDRCFPDPNTGVRDPTNEELIMLQKALSGVARTSHRGETGRMLPRFGANRIILMLTGSRSSQVVDAGLDSLSTFGILKQHGVVFVKALFKEMERSRLIQASADEYRMISLTALGADVMRGKKKVKLAFPEKTLSGSRKRTKNSG